MEPNYYATLIAVAEDCPVDSSVPPDEGGRNTVARTQYDMLAQAPYRYTQADVLFESWLRRQDPMERSSDELKRLREHFFARPPACLRASPLPKKHGFGFIFDGMGRVALCPVESEEYRRHLQSGELRVLKALRSSRGGSTRR